MQMRGAIFDADGTLLDSMAIWRELGQRYLAARGIAAEAGLDDTLSPMSLRESSTYLKQRYHLPDCVEKISADTLAMIQAYYLDEVTLKPGAAAYLAHLRQRRVPMIIATSNDRALVQQTLQRLGAAHCFCGILTCGDLGSSKREPTIYLEAARQLGTRPEETIVFEDALHGILAAGSAGFYTAAVEDVSNLRDRAALCRAADLSITDFTDPLLNIL